MPTAFCLVGFLLATSSACIPGPTTTSTSARPDIDESIETATTAAATTTTTAPRTTTPTIFQDDHTCGVPVIRPAVSNRIFGGVEAVPHSWPWQVSLCFGPSETTCQWNRCAGTIISNRHVLTSGYCAWGIEPHRLFIKAGGHRRSDPNVQTVSLRRITVHKHFQQSNIQNNDIAVLELNVELTFNDKIRPICLPLNDNGHTVANSHNAAWVTGWGRTKNRQRSDVLRQVQLPFVRDELCWQVYGASNVLGHKVMCMGDLEHDGNDACTEDRGGPPMKQSNGHWYQYGVIGFGHACSSAGYPSIYARVSEYCDFIKEAAGFDICINGN